MATTLQDLITEAALYVKAELVTTGSPAAYDTDSAAIVQRLISGINDAKNIIATSKFPMYDTDSIALDADSSFTPDDTTETFYKLVSVKYNDEEIGFTYNDGVITCDTDPSVTVSVTYQYIPADMTDLKNLGDSSDSTYVFPDQVDYRILCYKAAQVYYEINGGSSALNKASTWERKWKDALKRTFCTEDIRKIRDTYDWG